MLKFSEYMKKDTLTVGVISGRFQSVTKAHVEIIERLAEENDRGIVFLVKGKATSKDKERNPFDEDIQKRMLERILPENVEIMVIPTGFFMDKLNESEYSNFVLYTGTDRFESYQKQASYITEGKTLEVKEVKRVDEDISASKVRASLVERDEESFKSLTDERLHDMFEDMTGYLPSI